MEINRAGLPTEGEIIENPFGKGNLTTNGVQYGSANGTRADTDGFVAVGTGSIRLPDGTTLTSLELGLTSGQYGTNTTGSANTKWQVQDNGSTGWDDLQSAVDASTCSTDSATPNDKTRSGRFVSGGSTFEFTDQSTFNIRLVTQSASTGLGVFAMPKNSSYVKANYRYH